MSFPYNPSIPSTSSGPSQDASTIQSNFNSIQSLIAIDHVTFTGTSGTNGRHNQVTFNATQTPGMQSDPVSTLFTANGTASVHPNLNFINSQATFLLSAVNAFGSFNDITGATGNITPLNQFNVNGMIVKGNPVGGVFTYTITLNANVVGGNNIVFFYNYNAVGASRNFSYTLSNPVLTIGPGSSIGSLQTFSFLVLQA